MVVKLSNFKRSLCLLLGIIGLSQAQIDTKELWCADVEGMCFYYIAFAAAMIPFWMVISCIACCYCFDTKTGCCKEEDSGSDEDYNEKDKRLKNIEKMISKMKNDEPVNTNYAFGDSANNQAYNP